MCNVHIFYILTITRSRPKKKKGETETQKRILRSHETSELKLEMCEPGIGNKKAREKVKKDGK